MTFSLLGEEREELAVHVRHYPADGVGLGAALPVELLLGQVLCSTLKPAEAHVGEGFHGLYLI